MSINSSAFIQFIGYRVMEITYYCDPAFEFPKGEISYKFNFCKALSMISEKEIQEELQVNVFSSEGEDFETAPYKLTVGIAGRFTSKDEWQPQWETNVMAILFPYLRSLVSVITSNSGREPVILPTVNIASLFESDGHSPAKSQ